MILTGEVNMSSTKKINLNCIVESILGLYCPEDLKKMHQTNNRDSFFNCKDISSSDISLYPETSTDMAQSLKALDSLDYKKLLLDSNFDLIDLFELAQLDNSDLDEDLPKYTYTL